MTFFSLSHGVFPGKYLYTLNLKRQFIKKYFKSGCRVLVKLLNYKTVFSQILINKKKYIQYIRAAGTYAKIFKKYDDLKLSACVFPTKKVKFLSFMTMVTLGRNSNVAHRKEFLSKCGNNLKLGFKSKVRGVAMNPVDHPHGGRTKSNSPECSPWGWVAKKNK